MVDEVRGAAPSSGGGDPTALVMQLLTAGRSRRWKDVAGWGLAGLSAASWARARWKSWRQDRAYSVAIDEHDDIYFDVQEWLLEQIPVGERRGLRAATSRNSSRLVEVSPGPVSSPARSVHLVFDGAKPQRVMLGGHRVVVELTKRQLGQQDSSQWGEPARITFTAETLAGRDAAVGFLREVTDKYERRRNGASLYVAARWGDWQRASDMPARPLQSVVLAGDQRERLVEDLRRFIADEELYVSLGLPWHRGYLLHGPPGTGKTSIAKALAGHLGLDLFYVPLADLSADTDLARLLTGLQPRSVLLLEDIDIAHASKTRDDASKGVSLSGLLQSLDGVLTPHGLVTIMTTNHAAQLDEALVRAGRADVRVPIDYLVDEQLERLVQAVLPQVRPPAMPSVDGRQVSPADVIEMAKPHLRDPEAAAAAVYTGLLEWEPARA